MKSKAYKLEFYVPPEQAEAVKDALFAVGAGRWGAYAECCWSVSGQGQFRPLAGSDPFVGSAGELECLEELKIEMLVAADKVEAAIEALLRAHPYETPAFFITEARIGL